MPFTPRHVADQGWVPRRLYSVLCIQENAAGCSAIEGGEGGGGGGDADAGDGDAPAAGAAVTAVAIMMLIEEGKLKIDDYLYKFNDK